MHGRKPNIFIEDIKEAIDKINRYIQGLNYETFLKNDMVQDAVIRNLEIVGEAAKNIPNEIKEKYPDIPWRRMVGLRNIAVHEYFGVDLSIIWEIISSNLPETKPMIMKMYEDFNESRNT